MKTQLESQINELSLDELFVDEALNFVGGTEIGYLIGYYLVTAAKAYQSWHSRNADAFAVM